MKFENPTILYFLILLIIPIIIHLFNLRRYQKEFFSNVIFLKNIKEKSRKKKKIKNLIILFSRLMLITAVILAFAKPTINNKKIPTSSAVSIYIDNSLSMDVLNTETNKSLIDESKEIALSIINSLDENQKINVITNDFSYNNQIFYGREKAKEIINLINTSPFSSSLCNIIEKQKNIYDKKNSLHKFILSDYDFNFTSNSNCNVEEIKLLSTIKVSGLKTDNISINSCKFEHPFHQKNEVGKLIIELENHSDLDVESAQFKLYINEKQRGIYNARLPKKSIVTKEIDIINNENGNIKGKIELQTKDNYKYDNTLFFSYDIKRKINILSIYEEKPSRELNAVFNDSLFNLTNYNKNQIKISELKNYDLVILDHLSEIPTGLNFNINKILEQENNILIIPAKEMEKESYNTFLSSYNIDNISEWTEKDLRLKYININHWIFSNVFKESDKKIDLPKIKGYYKVEKKNLASNRIDILKLINNDFFFAEYKRKNGSIFLCTSPLSNNDFSDHAIFLPIMHNISRNNNSKELYHIIKKNLEIEVGNIFTDENVPLIKFFKNKEEETSFYSDLKRTKNNNYLKLNNEIKVNGNYHIYQKNNKGIFLEKYLSLNYDRTEGKINHNKNYSQNLAKLGLNLNKFEENKTLGKESINLSLYLMYISIFLFLTELLLLKFWRQ